MAYPAGRVGTFYIQYLPSLSSFWFGLVLYDTLHTPVKKKKMLNQLGRVVHAAAITCFLQVDSLARPNLHYLRSSGPIFVSFYFLLGKTQEPTLE